MIVGCKSQPNEIGRENILLSQLVFQNMSLYYQQFLKELIVHNVVSWDVRRKQPSGYSSKSSSCYYRIWFWLAEPLLFYPLLNIILIELSLKINGGIQERFRRIICCFLSRGKTLGKRYKCLTEKLWYSSLHIFLQNQQFYFL